jgi:stage V sporulation protein B
MNEVAQKTPGTGSPSEHTMARGTIYLMIATVFFIGSGYIIHLVMARMISADEYGRFGVLLALLQVIQVFLIKGIPDSVNKYIAEGRDTSKVKRIALRVQGLFSISVCFLMIIGAPFIAELLNDSDMTPFIMMIAIIIPFRALFSIFGGYLRGMRRFKDASFLSNMNSASRVIFVLLFLALGFGIAGAIGGYIAASMFSLALGIRYTLGDVRGPDVSSQEILHFGLPMIVFSACYLAMMNLDIIFAKALVENAESIGHYTAARLLASIILSIIMGLQMTLFPSISQSVSRGDHQQTRSYIEGAMRYVMMALVPITLLLAVFSKPLLTLLYPSEYSAGAESLSFLAIAISCIAIFILLGTILNGSGHPRISATISFCLAILSVPLNYYLIREHGITGGAMSMMIVGLLGMFSTGFFVFRKFRALIHVPSLLRIGGAGAVIAIIAFLVEPTNVTVVPVSLALLVIDLGLLFLFGEINDADVRMVRSLLGK